MTIVSISAPAASDVSDPQKNQESFVISRDRHPISRKMMSQEVLKVLYRLKKKGHLAYLCGGGVRDLLLGIKPKDFDVATDAHPGRLKKIFHNAWLVGKRFRLAHMVFKGGKIIEVSTFRKQSRILETIDDTGMIKTDNTFGTPQQDAFRRDFTINALYYNIADFSIIDYVGGIKDIDRRLVRCVGDPFIRFREDPIRICRGIRFAAHLEFDIEKRTWEAMVAHGPKVALCAPPRIQEELMRLLRGKRSAHGFRLLQEAGVSPSVLPEMNYLEKRHDKPLLFWDLLQALDTVRKPGEIFDDGLLWSIILLEPLFDMWNSGPAGQDPVREGYEWLNCVGVRLNIPKSVRRQILRMLSDLWVMVNCEEGKRVNKKITRIFSRTDFPNVLKLLEIYGIATKGDNSLLDLWKVRFLQWNKPYKRSRSGRGRRRKRKYSKKEVDNAAAV